MKFVFFYIFCFVSFSFAQITDFEGIDFTKADSIAKSYKKEELTNLPILSYKLTQNLTTDVEKFRAIFYWVCHNIKGDYDQTETVSFYREKFKNDSLAFLSWNKNQQKEFYKNLIKHKKTICTGYAYLVKKLCNYTDIECELINGYGRTIYANVEELESVNHSWNAVKLNNKWYLCDPTWASGYFINEFFTKDFNEGYFLTPPLLFANNHIPLNKKWMLIEESESFDFTQYPLLYDKSFAHGIEIGQPDNFKISAKQNEILTFSFKTSSPLKNYQISLLQLIDDLEFPYKIFDLKNENDTVSFKCKFKEIGNFDIHLKIKTDIVVTYNLSVSKI